MWCNFTPERGNGFSFYSSSSFTHFFIVSMIFLLWKFFHKMRPSQRVNIIMQWRHFSYWNSFVRFGIIILCVVCNAPHPISYTSPMYAFLKWTFIFLYRRKLEQKGSNLLLNIKTFDRIFYLLKFLLDPKLKSFTFFKLL